MQSMRLYLFGGETEKPTRFNQCKKFEKILPLLKELEKKEKELEAATKSSNKTPLDENKHVIVSTLKTQIDDIIKDFNKNPDQNNDNDIKEQYRLVMKLNQTIVDTFKFNRDQLSVPRNSKKKVAKEALHLSVAAATIGTAIFVPLSLFQTAAAYLGTQTATHVVANKTGLSNLTPRSVTLIIELNQTLLEIHTNLLKEMKEKNIQLSSNHVPSYRPSF